MAPRLGLTPMAQKIGYAVVGLGLIARNAVLPAFRHCRKAKLVGLVSRDKNKAARLRAKHNAAYAYGANEYDACLENPEVSAVYIATPPGEHEEFAVHAAAAGKHVLCEKPLAASVEQSAKMIEACRRHGVLLMTAYRKYFEPAALFLKSLVRHGALGRIDTILTSFSELYVPGVSQPWLVEPALAGGGPLMDLGIYCVNTSRWLVDEDPVEAAAESWREDSKRFQSVEEGIRFCLRFRSGLRVQGNTTYSAAMSSFMFVQGNKGWASFCPAFPFEDTRHVFGKIGKRPFERRFRPLDEFAPELDAFAEAIQRTQPVAPDGVQGHRDMIILQAIYNSAKSGRPVTITY
jgi:predicted dehydrogenase